MKDYIRSFKGEGESAPIPPLITASGGQAVHVDILTGLVFAKERRSSRLIAEEWSEKVYKGDPEVITSYTGLIPVMKARHLFAADTIDQTIPGGIRGKRVCDIGAGEGYFLYLLRDIYGADVFGVEPSRDNCRFLEGQGISCFQGTIEEYFETKAPDEPIYDLVTLNWTLCNTADCYNVVQIASRIVKEGGFIVVTDSSRIMTPYKKTLSLWMQAGVPVDLHPWFFSYNTIRCLLALCGIDPVFQNNHHEQNDLITIGKKLNSDTQSALDPSVYTDDFRRVLEFFENWAKDSEFYRQMDRGGYNSLKAS